MIASEDQYAVKQYFEFFRSTRIQFRVLETEDGASSPAHVMERLNKYIKDYDIGVGDEFWLVCDTDHWVEPNHIKNLVDVIRPCKQRNIGIALSNPCFDLWLLLHFSEFPIKANISCGEIGNRLRAAVGEYDKSKIYKLPISSDRVKNAISRSRENGQFSGDIPNEIGTSVYRIIEKLVELEQISITE